MDLSKNLSDFRKDLARCARCSLCKYPPLATIKSHRFSVGCPAINKYGFHAYSSGGKMIMALALLEDRVALSPEMAEVIYRCSTCGSCDVSCKYNRDLEPLEYILALRAECFRQGVAPLAKHKPILDGIREYANVWLQPRNRRDRWAKGLDIPDATKEKVEVLYFAGCTYAYNPALKDVPRTMVQLLQKGGVKVGTLGNAESCCASPAFTLGDRDTFRDVAAKNMEQWAATGARMLVTSCAGCLGLIKAKYPLVSDLPLTIVSAPEMVEDLIGKGLLKLDREVRANVTYHDPCHLGRQSEKLSTWKGTERKVLNQCVVHDPPKVFNRGSAGIYDAPRNILKAIPGVTLTEMQRVREYSFCCGSGGGVKSAFPEMAQSAATERLEEAKSTGARALVTSCPWCESNFRDAAKASGAGMDVVNLFALVAQSTGGIS